LISSTIPLFVLQDYGEAIQHLEDANWVLVDAVNRALPGSIADGGPTASSAAAIEHPPVEVIVDDEDIPPPPPHFMPAPPPFNPAAAASFFSAEASSGGIFGGGGSSSRSAAAAGVSIAADFLPLGPAVRSRLLELHIEYRDRMIHLKVRLIWTGAFVSTGTHTRYLCLIVVSVLLCRYHHMHYNFVVKLPNSVPVPVPVPVLPVSKVTVQNTGNLTFKYWYVPVVKIG
jgi:hypothetical protein